MKTLHAIVRTPTTEALRKDLAKLWNVAPYRVEVGYVANGELFITVDDREPTQEQCCAFAERASNIAAKKREAARQRKN